MAKKLLDGKISLVTGAASGIGKATAIEMAKEGASLIISDLEKDKCEAVSETIKREGGKAFSLPTDISDEDSIICLLYTSPSPRDLSTYRMPSSA